MMSLFIKIDSSLKNPRRFFVVAMLSFFTCSAALGSEKTLRIGAPVLRDVYDPIFSQGGMTRLFLRSIHANLVKTNQDLTIHADLANRWKVREKGRIFDFCIDESKKFNNGEAIKFEDIKFSLERVPFLELDYDSMQSFIRILDPKVRKSHSFHKNAEEICFSIELSLPYINYIYLLGSVYGVIVPNGSSKDTAIGSGKFRVSKKLTDNIIRFDRVEVSEDPGLFDAIEFHKLPWNQDSQNRLIEGRLDVFIGFKDYQKVPSANSNFKVESMRGLLVHHLAFNTKRRVFQNREFRRDIYKLFKAHLRPSTHFARFSRSTNKSMPAGIMPPRYVSVTQSDPLNFRLNDFVKKWKGRYSGEKIVLPAVFGELNIDSVQVVKDILKLIDIEFVYLNDLGNLPPLGVGDVEFTNWGAYYPKPEIFIDFYLTFGSIRHESKVYKLLKDAEVELIKASSISNPTERAKATSEIFSRLDEEYLVVPMFELYPPFIVSQRLKTPQTAFTYLLDLRDIVLKRGFTK